MSFAGALLDSLRAALEPSPYNPDDTTDLIGLALIYGFLSLLAAIAGTATAEITVRGQRKGKDKRQEDRAVLDEVSKKVTDVTTDVKAVRRQVNNDHPEEENPRDQMGYMQRQNDLLTELIKGQNICVRRSRLGRTTMGATFAASEPTSASCVAATGTSRKSTMTWCAGSRVHPARAPGRGPAVTDPQLEVRRAIYLAVVFALCAGLLVYVATL